MRIVEHYDVGMIAKECVDFWRAAGYRKIQAIVADGMAHVTIWGGSILRPTPGIRILWNELKIAGVCYIVERKILGGMTLRSSKDWDCD